MTILQTIEQHVPLSKEEGNYFLSLLETRALKQGEFIEKAGAVSTHFIHVKSGCLMSYYSDKEDADHVMQFSTAGWWTGDLNSFTKKIPASYTTRALADSELLLISNESMNDLLTRFPAFEKYFRILFQNSLITHQNRILLTISATAEERYTRFQKKYPSLEQFVPLKYIASYLGMTPEFLSKIRRRMMNA